MRPIWSGAIGFGLIHIPVKPYSAVEGRGADLDMLRRQALKKTGKDGAAPLCFVVHKHLALRLHFDLRLELDGVLKSWAVPKGPSLDPADKKLAVMVEDHPLDYGSFEGVIPEGRYGAGPVMIWDRGTYRAPGCDDRKSSEESLRRGLAKGHISFILDGQRLKGEFALVRLKRADENAWLLIKKNDGFARSPGEVGEETSVVSGRTVEEIAAAAKDPKSPGRPGRRGREWLKVKALLARETVAAGFTRPEGPPPAGAGQSGKGRGRLVAINDVKVDLTNLDKVFWPEEGYTKGDVIDYYRGVAPFILPYLEGRPESLRRNPDGIAGESFFQKNVDRTVPGWVETVSIRSETEGRKTVYLLCRDEATLVYMANLGCIEINPWHSRNPRLDNPDYMVLDLDPLDIDFEEVARAAQATRDVLVEIGARGLCKTSGATGLHVYVPLGGRYGYAQAVEFSRLVGLLVGSRLPKTTSLERDPAKRRGKVYLDFLQNGRGQTLAAAYCLRPRKGACVSTPLDWDEVNSSLDPGRFNMKTMMGRLRQKGDLWKDVLGPGIDMEGCLGRIEAMMKR